MDFRRQTLVHRTIERGLLKHFAMRRIGRERDVNLGWQTDDPARRVFRHFLLHRHGHAAQIDAKVLSLDSHRRAHAGGERGGNKIGG